MPGPRCMAVARTELETSVWDFSHYLGIVFDKERVDFGPRGPE